MTWAWCCLLLLALSVSHAARVAVRSQGGGDDIFLAPPAGATGPNVLVVLVPGGLVPIAHYVPILKGVQSALSAGPESVRVYAAVVQCLANLCDPLVDLNSRVLGAIEAAKQSPLNFNASATPADIVIMGHSLGAVGARYFVDYRRANDNEQYRGLALFGVMYNGDDEDLDGTVLGYPLSLARYPTPLLALAGELDFTPISHAALLYQQWMQLPASEQVAKPVVVIPSLDHSDFCPGFHVSGDIRSELPPAVAAGRIVNVTAAWLAALVLGASGAPRSAASLLGAARASAPMLTPFLTAYALDASWCAAWQLFAADQAHIGQQHVQVANTTFVDGLVQLAGAHPSYKVAPNGTLLTTNVAYVQHENGLRPVLAGAVQIACKGISRARVNSVLHLKGANQTEPQCLELNMQAAAAAIAALNATWPQALQRNAKQGGGFIFVNDSMASAGPLWVLQNLSFGPESSSHDATVQSAAIVTGLGSIIYPGSHYCKLLAPSRAVEWLQTLSLRDRYTASQKRSE